jgi:hypothetical protein
VKLFGRTPFGRKPLAKIVPRVQCQECGRLTHPDEMSVPVELIGAEDERPMCPRCIEHDRRVRSEKRASA